MELVSAKEGSAGQGGDAELDLYVRRDKPVEFGPTPAADYVSAGPGGLEWVVVPKAKAAAGNWFIAVASRDAAVADYSVKVRPLEESSFRVDAGEARTFVAPGSSGEGLPWLDPEELVVSVPAGQSTVWARVIAQDSEAKVEVYLRAAKRVEVEGRLVSADASSGPSAASGRVSISTPAAGDYFVAVRNLRPSQVIYELKIGFGLKAYRGDPDENGSIDINDAIVILARLFQGGGTICMAAADVDGNGGVNVADVTFLLSYLFQGGIQPAAPFPRCDALGGITDDCTGTGCR